MTIPITKTTCLAFALSIAIACIARAQEKKVNEMPGDSDIIQAVTLTHAAVEDVAEAIKNLHLPVRVSPTTDNRLLLRGGLADVKMVVDQVILKVDTPQSGSSRSTVEYIPVSHTQSESLMPLLEAVVPDPFGTHYALDAANHILVVNGPAESVAAIRKLVQTVDRPAESLHMHFAFLRAKIGTSTAEPAGVPKDLVPAAKALQQSGFSNVTLLAPVGVHARDGAHFQSESTMQVLAGEDRTGELKFALGGTPHLAADGTTVQLDLHASVSGRYADPPKEPQSTWFELKTSIAAMLDSYVILAAAPSSTTDGDAIVLAVRITRGSSAASH